MGDVSDILDNISKHIRDVTRLMTNGTTNKDVCLTKIDGCLSHLDSIRGSVGADRLVAIEDSLRTLREQVLQEESRDAGAPNTSAYCAERPLSGSRGRPAVQIETDQLTLLQQRGFTAVQMARHLGCSASLIYKRLASDGLQMRQKYSNISDTEVDQHTEQLHQCHNSAGSEMINGYLRASGLVLQRTRVRQSLQRIDPLSSAGRWSRAVTRRTYSVPTPNCLWHLDSHMKLVRWGFVTHGCVDGYSRLITFLQTSTSNQARVVLSLFAQACASMGLPSRVRCDHGGENIDVGMFMNLVRGRGRSAVIAGRSVHNQRIERLWRDVATQVTDHFYTVFYELEDEGVLDVTNDLHLALLRFVSLPMINERMTAFRRGWNSHRIRTEGNRSPEQLWMAGMLQNAHSNYQATAEVFGHTPSINVRIEQALQQFNLDLQPFVAAHGLQPPPVQVELDSDTAARVQAAVASISDLKTMFTTAVHIVD